MITDIGHLSPPAAGDRGPRTPTGRTCTPEDVASVMAYLALAANSHIKGQVVSVAGGRELVH